MAVVDQVLMRMRLEKTDGGLVTVGIFIGADEDDFGKCDQIGLQREEWLAFREGKARFQVKVLGEMPGNKWYLEDRITSERPSLKCSMLDYLNVGYEKRSLWKSMLAS